MTNNEGCPQCTYVGTPEQVDEHRATGVHNDEPQAGNNIRHILDLDDNDVEHPIQATLTEEEWETVQALRNGTARVLPRIPGQAACGHIQWNHAGRCADIGCHNYVNRVQGS